MAGARRTIAGALVVTGLLAAMVLSFIAVEPEDGGKASATEIRGPCVERPYEPPSVQFGGAHPVRAFYEPGTGHG